jgi:hypothetical protein
LGAVMLFRRITANVYKKSAAFPGQHSLVLSAGTYLLQ